MTILSNIDSNITANFTQAEKDLGVDLKLTPDGDLELSNLKDFKLIAGASNAAQALWLKLNIEPGSLLNHPQIGTDLAIGDKMRSAFDIQLQILRSLQQDPRFENVSANVQVIGNTIINDIRVTLKNTNVSIPLKFVSER